jgi:hypothetical protein
MMPKFRMLICVTGPHLPPIKQKCLEILHGKRDDADVDPMYTLSNTEYILLRDHLSAASAPVYLEDVSAKLSARRYLFVEDRNVNVKYENDISIPRFICSGKIK